MKKHAPWLVTALLSATAILATISCRKKEAEKTFTLKVGMVVTETDPMYQGAMELKKNVEARTNGKFKVEVFPSSQLGDTKDIMEQAKVGANVAAISDAALMSEIVPKIGVLAGPYVVDDYDQAKTLVTSGLFKGWCEGTKESGYKILSFNWYQGARHFMTNRPVKRPSDLKGMRIRTPGSPIFTDSINAMGANATALAWGEVYTGLQQKVIDGCEAQYPAIMGARLYETCKFIAKSGHFQLMTPLVVGSKFFDGLPADYQTILMEEAEKAGDFASGKTLDGLAKNEADMIAKGVVVTEVDLSVFKKASEPVYAKNHLVEAREEVSRLFK